MKMRRDMNLLETTSCPRGERGHEGFGYFFLRTCSNKNVPFLLLTTTSGSLSPLTSSTTNCVPMPESSSISWGVKEMMPSFFFASNQ